MKKVEASAEASTFLGKIKNFYPAKKETGKDIDFSRRWFKLICLYGKGPHR
jgi:hypothetical protein